MDGWIDILMSEIMQVTNYWQFATVDIFKDWLE